MNTIRISTPQNIDIEYDLASLGERIVGYIIDCLIIFVYVIALVIVASFNHFSRGSEVVILLLAIPVFFYDLASEVFMNGQSVGKRVMNIKVVSLDGRQPTLGQYVLRWMFRLVDFTLTSHLCGVICIAVSEHKQRVGDMVAGTTLVRTISRTGFQQTMYVPVGQAAYAVSYPQVVNLGDKDMQLIKEVLLSVHTTGNKQLAYHAAEKIMQTLHIHSDIEPEKFLQVLLADYNYLTSQGA